MLRITKNIEDVNGKLLKEELANFVYDMFKSNIEEADTNFIYFLARLLKGFFDLSYLTQENCKVYVKYVRCSILPNCDLFDYTVLNENMYDQFVCDNNLHKCDAIYYSPNGSMNYKVNNNVFYLSTADNSIIIRCES